MNQPGWPILHSLIVKGGLPLPLQLLFLFVIPEGDLLLPLAVACSYSTHPPTKCHPERSHSRILRVAESKDPHCCYVRPRFKGFQPRTQLLRNFPLRLIRRIINLRLKPLQQPLQKRRLIQTLTLQFMRMRYMPSQISQDNPPRKRILPSPAPNAHMLPLLRNPNTQHLKRGLIPLRNRRNTQTLLCTHFEESPEIHLQLISTHQPISKPRLK